MMEKKVEKMMEKKVEKKGPRGLTGLEPFGQQRLDGCVIQVLV